MLPLVMGATIAVTPKVLTLAVHGHAASTITATAPGRNLRAESTCYTAAGSANDILAVTAINTKLGAKSYSYSMNVKALRAGKCIITFISDANHTSVDVTVSP